MADLKARRRSHYPHIRPHTTRWLDNDVYGHLNNSIYYHLFDSLVNAFLITDCGFSPSSSTQIGLVVHSHCDYFGSVGYPAAVDVGLRVSRLGKSSVAYEVAVFEQGVEEVKAVGEFVHVFVEREGRRPSKEGMENKVKEKLQELVVRQAKL